MPGWSEEFKAGLKGSPYGVNPGRGRSDLEFVVVARNEFGGTRILSYSSSWTSPYGIASVDPSHIEGLSASDITFPGDEFDPIGGGAGGMLVSYKETPSAVSLRSWTPKIGGFTFQFTGRDALAAGFAMVLARGLMIEVYAGFPEFTWEQFQRINFGTIRQVSRAGAVWQVDCDEIFTMLNSPGGANANLQMFLGAGIETTIEEVVANNEADIDTGGGFTPRADLRNTHDHYVLQVTDNAITPKKVYLKIDVSSSVGATVHRPSGADGSLAVYGKDWFNQQIGLDYAESPGTVANAITSGEAAKVFYVVHEHFFGTFMRLMTSTGQWNEPEQNGTYDTLDAVLGFGIPHRLVWGTDMVNWHRAWPDRALGGFYWTPFFGAETDGFSEISKALRHFGMWCTMKEGMLTLRSAISHNHAMEGPGGGVHVVGDDDMVEVKKHDWYHTQCRDEYVKTTMANVTRATPPAAATDTAYDVTGTETRPIQPEYAFSTVNGPTHHLGGMDPDVTTCWEYQTAGGDAAARTFVDLQTPWFTRVPEYAEVVCAGLKYADACVGDIARVTTEHLLGPEGYWDDRPAMIQSVHRDWMNGTVKLGLAALPNSGDRF